MKTYVLALAVVMLAACSATEEQHPDWKTLAKDDAAFAKAKERCAGMPKTQRDADVGCNEFRRAVQERLKTFGRGKYDPNAG